MLAWLVAAGLFVIVLIVDAVLGGCVGILIGLFVAFALRRGPWDLVVPVDTMLGSGGFAVVQMGALAIGQFRHEISQSAGLVAGGIVNNLYEHNFRVGFVGALVIPVLYELYRASRPQSQR